MQHLRDEQGWLNVGGIVSLTLSQAILLATVKLALTYSYGVIMIHFWARHGRYFFYGRHFLHQIKSPYHLARNAHVPFFLSIDLTACCKYIVDALIKW